MKVCNSATSLRSNSFSVSRLATISASNCAIDKVDLSVATGDPDHLFITCGGKVQIWNLLQPNPIMLSVYDTKLEKLSDSVYPIFDFGQGLLYLPSDQSHVVKSVVFARNHLPQLRLPSIAAQQLVKYKLRVSNIENFSRFFS